MMNDYELAVIDSCIVDKKNIPIVLSELQPRDFEEPLCRKAFATISGLFES